MNKIYEAARKKYLEEEAEYQAAHEAYEQAKKRLNTISRPLWVNVLVKPIANYLQEKLPDTHISCGGPFGLGAHACIWIHTRHTDEYLTGIIFDLVDLEHGVIAILDYENKVYEYPPNSLGEINNLGYGTKPLPDDLDELVEWARSAIKISMEKNERTKVT